LALQWRTSILLFNRWVAGLIALSAALPSCGQLAKDCTRTLTCNSSVPVDASASATADSTFLADSNECAIPGSCTRCTNDADCAQTSENRHCLGGACAECTDDTHCTDRDASQCSPGGSCIPCDAAAQCEDGLQCNDGRCVQCLAPGECMSATAAFCNPDGICAECADNAQCSGIASKGVCDTGKTPNECVECVTDDDCTDPTTSQCTNNVCGECQNNEDCAGQPEGGVCDTSQNPNKCVQCTGLQDGACDGRVCDSRARLCSNATPGTAQNPCDACVADKHCGQNMLCVPQVFGGTELGLFCLQRQSDAGGDCFTSVDRPFSFPISGTSVDGVSTPVCGLELTTCAGLRDRAALRNCGSLGPTGDAVCGAPGLNDGICRQAGAQFVCAVPCESDNDCITNVGCVDPVNSPPICEQ
jgi:hypothetical protein